MTRRTIAAEVLLRQLALRGVEHVFGNAGTDFPSIIEAYASAGAASLPPPLTVPHENLAVAMAHGAYLASGRPQAVMVHVSVGTANAVCGMLNACRENIPVVLLAGRTPVTEHGPVGARNAFIHWGQELFDQASMVRETVKWEYELRRSDQIADVVDRGVDIAMAHPRGPVYVTLPREILAEQVLQDQRAAPAGADELGLPSERLLERASSLLSNARKPVLVTSSLGKTASEFAALERFASRQSIPVISYRNRYLAVASDSRVNAGHEIGTRLQTADLVLAVETDVPWIPEHHPVNPDAAVVHIGVDPRFQRYPMRSFRSDLALAGDVAGILERLAEIPVSGEVADARRLHLEEAVEAFRARMASLRASSAEKATAAWAAQCLSDVLDENDIVVVETGFPLGLMRRTRAGTYFAPPSAGGLGWGLGAALGLKLGNRQRRVVAVVGDGAYMFGNPTPAHFVSAAYNLPFVTLVLNNGMWAGVRRATLALYPEGAASRSNDPAFTMLQPSPCFERIVEASGGYGECVENARDLPEALKRALYAVDVEKRQAVLNIRIEYTDEEARRDARM